MKRILIILCAWLLTLLCIRCASAQFIPGDDDIDPVFPIACGSNSNQNAGGCSSFGTSLYTFLAGESPAERSEYGWANFVVAPGTYGSPSFTYTVPSNDCLGIPVAGLTHTPPSCYVYNANVRATETGAITYPNNSTCWVGIDQNRTGVVGDPANFTRVAGEHYIIDCIDPNQPAMTSISQLLMEVTTSGGAITNVIDLRRIGPVPSYLAPPQGLYNIGAFPGFSSSLSTTTVAVVATQTSGTLTSATGFNPGDQVVIRHGGANATISSPTNVTLALLTDGTAVSAEQPSGFTGDGATKCFLGTLAHGRPKIGSVQVTDSTDSVTSNYDTTFGTGSVFNPTGHGYISGTGITSGDVDYLNARVGICFSVAPSNGAALTVNYSYVAPTATPIPRNAACTKDITTDNGTEAGSNCTTSWGVRVVAHAADGSSSAPSAMVTIQNAPKFPSWANRIRMNWTGDSAAVGYRIFMCRDTSNTSPANCTPTLVASNDNIWYKNTTFQACAGCATPTNYDYDYIGSYLPGASNGPSDNVDGQALPAGSEPADLSTTITALNGTAATFANAPSQTGTLTIVHDIMPVIKATLTAATASASNVQEIWLPCGSYAVATQFNLTNQLAPTIHGCGSGSSAGQGTQLYWFGGSAMTAFNFVNVASANLEDISFGGNSNQGSDLGAWVSYDGVLPYNLSVPTQLRLIRDSFRNAGDPVVIGNRSTADVENGYIQDTWMQGVHRHQYAYYLAGAVQTYGYRFVSGAASLADVGWMMNGAGGVSFNAAQGSSNAVDFADGEPLSNSSQSQAISIVNFFDQTINIAFQFLGASQALPPSISYSYLLPSNGNPQSIPSTSQPTIPASGAIGMTGGQGLTLIGDIIGFYALPIPQQIWAARAVSSHGNIFMQTTPPFVVYTTTSAVSSGADVVAAQGNSYGTYGAIHAIGSLASPAGPGLPTGNVLSIPKISGFTTVSMPVVTTTLTQVGSGANTCHYQVVVVDSGGNATLPSVDNSVSCPTVGAFSSANYVKISTNTTGIAADHVDILTSATRTADTAHTIGSFPCSGQGVCFGYDLGQGVIAYTAPTRNNSGDITLASGAMYHNTPTAIASLPTTCTVGDAMAVSNWNGTTGTCTAGAPGQPTTAHCGSSNVWSCP